MLSDSSSKPYSTIYLALFVQNPNLDVIQPIYVRDTLTKGRIQEITTDVSLKTFLERQDQAPSGKWYEVVKMMKIPGKNSKHPIHFWLPPDHGLIHFWVPRDQDLKVGILSEELIPIQNGLEVMHCKPFEKLNKMNSYMITQIKLNGIFQHGLSDRSSRSRPALTTSASSSSDSIAKLPPMPASEYSSSRRVVRKSPSIKTLPFPISSLSSSSIEPSVTLLTPPEPPISISEIQSTSIEGVKIRRCDEIFVKVRDVYVTQSIYVMLEGKLQEITITSLEYLLQKQPRTASGDAIEYEAIINDEQIHFHLPIKSHLTIGVIDSRSMPIKDKSGRVVSCGLTNALDEVSDSILENIQGTLSIWPSQYRPRKISSASDPRASFRTAPPSNKMRPVRSFSGPMSPPADLKLASASSSNGHLLRLQSDPRKSDESTPEISLITEEGF
jgi:hypothetical protein